MLIPLARPIPIETSRKERKAFNFAQVVRRISKRIPDSKIKKDMVFV
jgi:hypothetical protein